MKSTTPTRVNYFDNQFLRRNEFADEQQYQIDQRRRHNISHHTWGIVIGLEIVIEEGELSVRPGLAVDGYGRELFLTVKSPIRENDFNRLGTMRLDVWLLYEKIEGAKTPSGYVACDSENAQSRISERPRVLLERAGAGHIDSRRPKGVPAALLGTTTQLRTTDDPLAVWPIYLGRVTRVLEESDPSKQYVIDASDRVYAGIVAEVVDHPGNGNRISLGPLRVDNRRRSANAEYTYETHQNSAFAVYVTPTGLDESLSDEATQEIKLDARFAIDDDDKNFLRGQTSIQGNLQIKGALQFTDPTLSDELNLAGMETEPLIYRIGKKPDDVSEEDKDELRIDLGSVDVVSDRKLVIGFTSQDGKFIPSVTLEYKQTSLSTDPLPLMTIEGDLTLKGKVNCQSLITRSLSPETLNALLASFQAGSIAAGGQ